jgi:hypothetical protein
MTYPFEQPVVVAGFIPGLVVGGELSFSVIASRRRGNLNQSRVSVASRMNDKKLTLPGTRTWLIQRKECLFSPSKINEKRPVTRNLSNPSERNVCVHSVGVSVY